MRRSKINPENLFLNANSKKKLPIDNELSIFLKIHKMRKIGNIF